MGTLWLLAEVAMLTSKLVDLLGELNNTLETSCHVQVKSLPGSSIESVTEASNLRPLTS